MLRNILIVVAVLFSGIAIGQEDEKYHAMYFDNNKGGKTIITDRYEYCAKLNMFDGYAYSKDFEEVVKFCWVPRGDAVLVLFDGKPATQPTTVWPMMAFKVLNEEPDLNILFSKNKQGS